MNEMKPGTELLPGWEVVRLIGGGGFGKVYEAKKDDTGVIDNYHSAIKVITIPQSNDDIDDLRDNGYDDESIAGLYRNQVNVMSAEFDLMAEFKGMTNIVSYEDHRIVRHEDGLGWDVIIRMELLESLPIKLKKEGFTEEEVVRLGIEICTALELCAKKNIIHRDIKPQNIFLNQFGNFKLGDFGIARTMDHKTKATVTGTPDYMAPEVRMSLPYDATVDQYSLGMMMYWLLNERRLPFLPLPPAVPTSKESEKALARRLRGEPLPEPKNGSDGLKKIVLKACAYQSEERYSGPTAMKLALMSLPMPSTEPILLPVRKKDGTVQSTVTSASQTPIVTGSGNGFAFSRTDTSVSATSVFDREGTENDSERTMNIFDMENHSSASVSEPEPAVPDDDDNASETISPFSSAKKAPAEQKAEWVSAQQKDPAVNTVPDVMMMADDFSVTSKQTKEKVGEQIIEKKEETVSRNAEAREGVWVNTGTPANAVDTTAKKKKILGLPLWLFIALCVIQPFGIMIFILLLIIRGIKRCLGHGGKTSH